MNARHRFPLMATCVLLTCALTAGVAAADIVTYTASLDGASTLPPSGSSAAGTAVLTIDTDLSMATGGIALHVEFSGLSSGQTAAGLYAGSTTSNGTLLRSLTTGSPLDTTLTFVLFQLASFLNALYADNLNLTISTADHAAGEIRGNFTLTSTVDHAGVSWGEVKALYR